MVFYLAPLCLIYENTNYTLLRLLLGIDFYVLVIQEFFPIVILCSCYPAQQMVGRADCTGTSTGLRPHNTHHENLPLTFPKSNKSYNWYYLSYMGILIILKHLTNPVRHQEHDTTC